MGNNLMIPNVDIARLQVDALMNASTSDIAKTQANALVDITRIQADVAKTQAYAQADIARYQAYAEVEVAESQAYAQVEVARINAYSAITLESMRLDAAETRDLVASASDAMSKTLAIYAGVGAPGFMHCRVKSKLSGFLGTGLFGKSCTITVEARFQPNYYLRGPAK